MTSSSPVQQRAGLFSSRTFLVLVSIAVVAALLVLWPLGLTFQSGQAAAFVFFTLLIAAVVIEFARRRFRLSMRSMLLLVTALCVLCAVFGNRLVRMRQRQQAINHLQRLGADLAFDFEPSGSWFITESGVALPGWTRSVFGEAMFAKVIDASLNGSGATDDDLAAAAPALTEISTIVMDRSSISGYGLRHLFGCRQLRMAILGPSQLDEAGAANLTKIDTLETLRLYYPSVTDAHVAPLAVLRDSPNLQNLSLMYSGVTDAGMKYVGELTQLRSLGLQHTAVGDAGLAELKNMTALQDLHLSATAVTDDGMKHLGALTQLRFLELHRTAVGDAGLAELRNLTALEHLYLSGTAVTDDGMPHLYRLKNLRVLVLPAAISDEAAAKLQRSLPNCRITK